MLLILLLLVPAVVSISCPATCTCGETDELNVFCRLPQTVITFDAHPNYYVNVRCHGSNFSCSDLPTFNFGNNLTLPSLGVKNCPAHYLRCVNQNLNIKGASVVTLTNISNSFLEEDVQDLLEMRDLIIMNAPDPSINVDVISKFRNLASLRVSKSTIQLKTDQFLGLPPIHLLELSSSKIPELPPGGFNGLSNLTILYLWGNNFSEIGVNSLKGLDSLEILTLNNNRIYNITAGSLNHTPKLKSLNIYGNYLGEVPQGLLYNLSHIENITIQSNNVELKLQEKSIAELPSLKKLLLERLKIKNIPENLLVGNTGLKTLSLYFNEIATLPTHLFRDLKSLEILNLSKNRISRIDGVMFSHLKKLRSLNFNMNNLEVLPDYLFSGLTNLEDLSLDHNIIHTISPSAFQGSNLKSISLIGNKLSLQAHDQAIMQQYYNFGIYSPFSVISGLKKLYLSGNEINTIFDDWKSALLQLEVLDLSWNEFTELDFYDVQFLSNNVTVDLRNNNISTIRLNYPELASGGTLTNRSILLENNPLNCDCGLYTLALRLEGAKSLTAEPKFVLNNAKCSTPYNFRGRIFKTVSSNELYCDLPAEDCPNNCTCEIKPGINTLSVFCKDLPKKLPEAENFGAKYLALTLGESPESLEGLNLNLLNLSGVGLKEITFEPSKLVNAIDFSNNNLYKLPLEFFASNTTLYLSGNPWECDCWYANEISLIQNSIYINDTDVLRCLNGDLIKKIDVSSLCSSYKAAIMSSGIFAVLLFIAILTFILIKTYKNECFIYLSRILPCLFTDDMTDSDKTYDVFISYAHKDLEFFKILLPKLENDYQQKTCLHYRDWSVGDLIPEQIDRSVAQSKKTIVLLSKNFLESTYANMEFRSAHNHALNEGKSRVILILLEDILEEKLTDDIKAYINTNTYLTWDDPRFWERLQKALPKKNIKKLVWPEILKEGKINRGLDVHLNSDGKLVNVASKDI